MRNSFLSGAALAFLAVTNPLSTASAGSVQITPTDLDTSIRGCVGDGSIVSAPCGGSVNLLDLEDDTIELFEIANDVAGFSVFEDPAGISSDVGSANVLLNGELVGVLSTESPIVLAAFGDTSLSQVVEIVNTDAAKLVYIFSTTPVPVPAAVWLFGSALVGLVGVARRRSKLSAA